MFEGSRSRIEPCGCFRSPIHRFLWAVGCLSNRIGYAGSIDRRSIESNPPFTCMSTRHFGINRRPPALNGRSNVQRKHSLFDLEPVPPVALWPQSQPMPAFYTADRIESRLQHLSDLNPSHGRVLPRSNPNRSTGTQRTSHGPGIITPHSTFVPHIITVPHTIITATTLQ